jgi:hypothetical protein
VAAFAVFGFFTKYNKNYLPPQKPLGRMPAQTAARSASSDDFRKLLLTAGSKKDLFALFVF